jgi:hypothetical protein
MTTLWVPLLGIETLDTNEWLGIDFPVYIDLKELPESVGINVCRRELRFFKILSGSRDIVVPGKDVGGGKRRGREGERTGEKEEEDTGQRVHGFTDNELIGN